uniref:Uncharacterized protein n=1 Tax=Anguilla anguilla TaxID=7936 RepID=A0A0E9PWC5_ANGAN
MSKPPDTVWPSTQQDNVREVCVLKALH